jgi:hypothetical protein
LRAHRRRPAFRAKIYRLVKRDANKPAPRMAVAPAAQHRLQWPRKVAGPSNGAPPPRQAWLCRSKSTNACSCSAGPIKAAATAKSVNPTACSIRTARHGAVRLIIANTPRSGPLADVAMQYQVFAGAQLQQPQDATRCHCDFCRVACCHRRQVVTGLWRFMAAFVCLYFISALDDGVLDFRLICAFAALASITVLLDLPLSGRSICPIGPKGVLDERQACIPGRRI